MFCFMCQGRYKSFICSIVQQASNQLVLGRSKIIEMLQAQKDKEEKKLEELKQRWNDYTKGKRAKSPSPNTVEVSAGKGISYT